MKWVRISSRIGWFAYPLVLEGPTALKDITIDDRMFAYPLV